MHIMKTELTQEESDALDIEMSQEPDLDFLEPEPDSRFYTEYRKLWEMRFGYREDKTKSFEENIRSYIKYNYERCLVKKILDIKITYFYETGKILC